MPRTSLSLNDLDALASLVGPATADEPQEAVVALAWCLVNRLQAGDDPADVLTEAAHGLKQPRDASHMRGATRPVTTRPVDPRMRALAYIGLASCGELADPTFGATLFHRHDNWPAWAMHREPAALAGSFFFYPES